MRLLMWLIVVMLSPVAAGAQEVAYRVELVGVEGGLRDRVEAASRLVQLADEPPASLVSLTRRAEGDVERIQEVLRSEGYYAGSATVALDDAAIPVAVTVTIVPGPAFTLSRFDVRFAPIPAAPPDPDIVLGERARAEDVVAAQTRLMQALAERGYPLAEITERRAVVDHATATMAVDLLIGTGPEALFGPVTVRGLDRLDEGWVRRRLPWEPGERFSVTQMEEMRKRLVASRLFSSIKLATGTGVDAESRLPVAVELAEADRRSIGASVTWSSTEGVGTEAFWEHRNLAGGAERLRTALVVSEIRTGVDLTFRKPDFLAADQDLRASTLVEEQRTEAYVTRTAGGAIGLEWLLSPHWRAGAGTALERTLEERDAGTRTYTLVSFPLEIRHDSTDDILDPRRGNRLSAQLRPFVEALGGTAGFTRFDLQGSHYLEVSAQPRLILAGWGRVAAIRGGGLDEVPANHRLYVGGGGSVRAYGFQQAGPLDDAGDPTGGLSALAFGAELRARLTETIGIVPFVEAGTSYVDKWPDPANNLLWGAGLGLRYHTPIGPVRADVAVPLNRRSGIDDSFQIYLSLGQAF
jgi:translocation and assembly module TamA